MQRWRWQGDAEQRGWAAALRLAIEGIWSSVATGIGFVLDKPGWPATQADITVVVEVDDATGAQVVPGPQVPVTDRHLDMVVWKEPPDVVESAEGSGSRDNIHALMRLSSNSATGRTDNPLVFLWDPHGIAGHLSNVEGWAADHRSAATALGSRAGVTGKVPDPAGQRISMIVRGPTAAGRSRDTVDLINAITRGCGDASRIHRVGELVGPRGAGLWVGDGRAQVTAAHEFGHLFGLADEYAQRGIRSPGDQAGHSAQAAAMGPGGPTGALVESNDNIMSEGRNVRPQHYAIFLDAIRKVTGLPEWRLR